MILTIDIGPLLAMKNTNDDDGMSSIQDGEMGATGGFKGDHIGERDDEDDISGSEYGYSPNQSPNPKDAIKPGKKDIMQEVNALKADMDRLKE